MGRGKKKLYEEEMNYESKIIDKREVGYYYTPDFVAEYIAKRMLQIKPEGVEVLDPCCGKEELLKEFIRRSKKVAGFDIIKYKEKYNIDFQKRDFIDYYSAAKHDNKLPLKYDYYIANPPYNCHEVNYIKDNKKKLNEVFSDVGTHNMYSMFISALIDCAKEGAVLGIITSDSFFTAVFHKKLREKILANCTIHEITMCPTDLFLSQNADVRTRIIILEKGGKNQGTVTINNRSESKERLKEIMKKQEEHKYSLPDMLLNHPKDNCEFILECPKEIREIFNNKRLGDMFKCVTGISTGNDKKYLSEQLKEPYTVPFYKNPGKNRFYTDNCLYIHKDFLNLSKTIKNFTVRNKELMFKSGISCSSMGVQFTASRLPQESVFGVNANIICDDKDAWWLMAYLNSNLVTYLVRRVLIRSNMITSGYVSRIPVINIENGDKYELQELSKRSYELASNGHEYLRELKDINSIVNRAANISKPTEQVIELFIEKLVKNT